MTLEELKTLYAKLNVTFQDDLTLKRAVIYYRFVKPIYDSLKQELSKIKGYEKVAPALTQSDLLKDLCKILDPYTISAVNAALKQPPTTYGQYFDIMIRDYPDSVDRFLFTYPLIHAALETLARHFGNNILTACKRILNDWGPLLLMFADKDSSNLKNLINIESTGSDFHKGGQQVLILTFAVSPSNRPCKIVYKPSDLEVDCLIIGDSQAVNVHFKPKPPFQEESLVEILNKLAKQDPSFKLEQLPTYKILPRNPGSKLTPKDGKLSIRDSYGYIEYLAHEELLNRYSGGISDFKIFQGQNRKAICTRFYTLLGQLTAIAAIFSLSDLHMQNLIVHKYLPYLIDLENSLIEPINSLEDTHLLSGQESGGAIDGIVSSSDIAQVTNSSKEIKIAAGFQYQKNRLWDAPNMMISPGEFAAAICRSFDYTMIWICKCLQSNNPFASWFARLEQGAIVRFVPLPTDKFQKSIKEAFDANVNTDEYVKKQMKAELEKAYDQWCGTPTLEPKFLCLQERYVINDMLQLDVPAFYHQLSTLNVLDSHGTVIDVPDRITIRGKDVNVKDLLGRLRFFPTPPLDHICNVQLLGLRDPETLMTRVGKFLGELTERALWTAQIEEKYHELVEPS